MSRGRGRGRGRGGSTAGRDQFNAAFAGMSKEDSRAVLESFSKPVKGSGMLYPPLDKAAEMPGPTGLEDRVIFHTNVLLRDLAEGLEEADGERSRAPWRLESERKVVGIEIESYSDRYRRSGANPGGSAHLDPDVLHLNRDLFPPALWTEYFEGNTGAEKKARAIARANRRKRVLDDDDDEGDGEPSDNEEAEEDFDFDDEDEEDHQDYDHNYFDNGEGDDDSGGEGGDDDGGRYDD